MWILPKRSDKKLPLYKQVIGLIEQAVENGLLGGGERLPSERRLGDLLGVNRSTIIRALENLAERGILLRRQGSGTYVNNEKWGVQKYPALNWLPSAMPEAERFDRCGAAVGQSGYRRGKINKSGNLASAIRDLSSEDLPGTLLPSITLPEGSWQDILRRELDDESSLTGLATFKEAVRGHLRRGLGLEVEPGQLLITSGARQAFFLIAQCLLRPGDAIGIEAPSYFYSLPVFQAAGLRLFAIPTDERGITPDGLDMVTCRRGLKMIFLNPVFQNPTGHVMDLRRKREIFNYCAARHIPIVEDDAYSQLAFCANTDIAPIKSLDRHGQALYIGSLSSYMGKSIRAGWLAAPEGVVRKLALARQCIDAGPSVLPQFMAGHYLDSAATWHMSFLRAELTRRAAALERELAGLRGEFSWAAPQGGFYFYLRAEDTARTRGGPPPLERLWQCGIIAASGVDFGGTANELRLNFAWL